MVYLLRKYSLSVGVNNVFDYALKGADEDRILEVATAKHWKKANSLLIGDHCS